MNMEMNHKKRIEDMIKSQRVFVFMKGSAERPACRFSVQVVELLEGMGVSFGYFDVMEDEGMRQAIKDFSGWPTIPQVFVEGKFVGGADVLQELFDNGELKVLLG